MISDGTTYNFGSNNGGLVTFSFTHPQPDTTEDKVAFGFTTSMQARATLAKLTSSNSDDILQIYIVVWQ